MNPYLTYRTDDTIEIPKVIDDENEFNRIGVELFTDIGQLIITASSIIKRDDTGNDIPYSKEEAVIIGSLVRYGKLSIGFIEQYTQARLEISMIMLRCLSETYVNLMYFIKYADAHTVRHYIKHSLQTEKQILGILRENTKDKELLEPIETRIIESAKRAFDEADFDEKILNNSSKWNTKIKQRLADIMGPEAYALVYGMSSHSIHGNWQDLVHYQLKKTENGYLPNPDWTMPRLQILSAATIFSCDVLSRFVVRFLPDDSNRSELLKIVGEILERIGELDGMHEQFIQKERKTATNKT